MLALGRKNQQCAFSVGYCDSVHQVPF